MTCEARRIGRDDSRPQTAAQSFQKSRNRSGESSLYLTVCWMFLWPRQCCSDRVSTPWLANLNPVECRNMWGWMPNGILAAGPSQRCQLRFRVLFQTSDVADPANKAGTAICALMSTRARQNCGLPSVKRFEREQYVVLR